jgi:hypothetical protein
MKEVNIPNCGRENDLLDFLYGEMNDLESRTFQLHVDHCLACSAELAGLKDVRQSVVEWRNESLGGLFSPVINRSAEPRLTERKPSALAALREFFNLSPLWMKGAVAFASLLFVMFAGLAIVSLRDKPPVATATNQASNANSEQQLKDRVAQLQDELRRAKKSAEQPPVAPVIVKNGPDKTPIQRAAKRDTEVAANVSTQKLRRPLSKTEREQLAADLRLTSARNDSDAVLLEDRINQ